LPVKPAHKLITFVSDRPGHDRRYAIDISKIRQTLGWSPKIAFRDGLTQILQWYIEHADWWCPLLPEVDQQCYSRLYGAASPGSSGN
ncbi:MAG: GDP-mannose 4,6-dehydratase, partial [Cyanobacteria bacterium P01_H01_bin.119]